MLQDITIENFSIVEKLQLTFDNGLNVMTGETGAGKSIWVDAIALALGQRADSTVLRPGSERCSITLCFDITHNPTALHWLQTQELDDDEQCIIRRTINAQGQSRSTINGTPCPQARVREFAKLLILIHSQHQHQHLLSREFQREQVDRFAKNQTVLEEIAQIYDQWQMIDEKITQWQAQAASRDARLSLLRYQLNELEALTLQPNEWQTLSEEHRQLHQANDLIQALSSAIDITSTENQTNLLTQLHHAVNQLSTVKTANSTLNNARELLESAHIQITEANHELVNYRDQLDLSPEHLAQVEQRLSLLSDIARKHHVEPEQLIEVQQRLTADINALDNLEDNIKTLNLKKAKLEKSYESHAETLSTSRKTAAQKIEKQITKAMQQLAMEGGKFQVMLTPHAQTMTRTGREAIEFRVKTNPGGDYFPLSKHASGGELSRLSLALQVLTAEQATVPTLIFDEVDVGIGGKTAVIVGQLLARLGKHRQLFCITHLPQVAACGQHHFRAVKIRKQNSTKTTIEKLDGQARTQELARMLGGKIITEQTLAAAKELLPAAPS